MAQTGIGGHRQALRSLRTIMAGDGSAQDRLDRIVKVIAAEMVAEVCSVYVMRAGELLELFATEGLNPSAVHRTRLRVGEGLVGEVAARAPRPEPARRPGPSAVQLSAGDGERRFTTPSWACPCSAGDGCAACSSFRTGRRGTTRKKKSKRLR